MKIIRYELEAYLESLPKYIIFPDDDDNAICTYVYHLAIDKYVNNNEEPTREFLRTNIKAILVSTGLIK